MGVARTLLHKITTLIGGAAACMVLIAAPPLQAGPLQDMIDATPPDGGGEVVPPAAPMSDRSPSTAM